MWIKSISFAMVCVLASLSSAVAADLKIGVVDPRVVISQSPDKDSIESTLVNEFKDRRDSLIKLNDELQELAQKAQRDGMLMTDKEKLELKRNAEAKNDKLQRQKREMEEDFQIRKNEELQRLLKRIQDAIETVAKREGFDIILSNEAAPYISERADITGEVVALISKSSSKK